MTNKTNRTQILFLSLITVVACFLPIFTLSATPVDLAKKSEVSQKYYEGTLYAVALGEESEYDLAEDDETLEALDKKYEEIEALLDRIEKMRL